ELGYDLTSDLTADLTADLSADLASDLSADLGGDELLAALAGIEIRSEHPLAAAIVAALADQGIAPAEVDDFRAMPGKGAQAVYKGERYYVGNLRLFEKLGVDLGQARPMVEQHHR